MDTGQYITRVDISNQNVKKIRLRFSVIVALFLTVLHTPAITAKPKGDKSENTQKKEIEKTNENRPIRKPDDFEKTDLIKRRVLILDFTNPQKSESYGYLKSSIPDAFFDSIEKTNNFIMLPRSKGTEEAIKAAGFDPDKFDLFSEQLAVKIGKKLQADVVVIGNLIAFNTDFGVKIKIQARAVDVDTGQVMVSKSKEGMVDGTIFVMISILGDLVATDMTKALPPIPQDEMLKKLRERYPPIRITITGLSGVPLIGYNEYLKIGYGAKFSIEKSFFLPWLSNVLEAGYTTHKGIAPLVKMSGFIVQTGFTFPFESKKLYFAPRVLGGIYLGKAESLVQQGDFLVPMATVGFHFGYYINPYISILLATEYTHHFDPVMPSGSFHGSTGISFRFLK